MAEEVNFRVFGKTDFLVALSKVCKFYLKRLESIVAFVQRLG